MTSNRIWYRIETGVRSDIFSALESAAPVLIDAAIAQPPGSPERHSITTALARLYVALDELPYHEKPDGVRRQRAFTHYEDRAERAIELTIEHRGPQGITKKDWIRSGGLGRQVFNKTDYVKAMESFGGITVDTANWWADWRTLCRATYCAILGEVMPKCALESEEAQNLYYGVMVANVWPGPEGSAD